MVFTWEFSLKSDGYGNTLRIYSRIFLCFFHAVVMNFKQSKRYPFDAHKVFNHKFPFRYIFVLLEKEMSNFARKKAYV